MKKMLLLFAVILTAFSCNVTESIIINENGSGEYLTTYDMGDAITMFAESMGGGKSGDSGEKKEGGEKMDTTMVFRDIMEENKDSIAALPEDKRLMMESLKDMYMRMYMDEDKGEMEIGIGMNFKSMNDLKDIQDKLRKAQTLNERNSDMDQLKDNPMLGMFFGNESSDLKYTYDGNAFTRNTYFELPEGQTMEDVVFNEDELQDKELMKYFESAYYTVELTFPKKIKSHSVKDAKVSDDGKTLTYKANWIDYLKDPKRLDVNVEFVDE
ncbi:hypothetical protein [Winogradskyella sp. 3972H.M.0a.05]|uniref:hypothetical protein n=1 Tax=Winogradskyella sp. 3972H.M.0a.05 TaxID=2950277 RepID=UPI003390FC61